MPITALSETSVSLPVDALWVVLVQVTDYNDVPVTGLTLTLTVKLPSGGDGIGATTEELPGGLYRVTYTIANTGRHIMRIRHADHGVVELAAWVDGAIDGAGMPSVATIKANYLRDGEHSYTDGEIGDALAAEAAAQRGACHIPAAYPADLAEALSRRVVRNLAMRSLPLAMLRGDADGGDAAVIPGRDPEIRRLERAHPKLPTG